jgi:hypothetical protein
MQTEDRINPETEPRSIGTNEPQLKENKKDIRLLAGFAVGSISGVILSRYVVAAGKDPEDIFTLNSGIIGAGAGTWLADRLNSFIDKG